MSMYQEKLIEQINNFKQLPQSMLLLGEEGAGQLDICKHIAERYNMNLVTVSSITREVIDQIYLMADVTLFVIDVTILTEREQNMMLKVFEDPNAFSYILMYGESSFGLLETILNRSFVLKMQDYTREQLLPLVSKDKDADYILSLCTTPGQVEIANHTDTVALKKLCVTFIQKLETANINNALSIANKINYSDEYDKFDIRLFLKALKLEMINNRYSLFFDDFIHFYTYIWYMNDKKRFFENFIIKAWIKARSSHENTAT